MTAVMLAISQKDLTDSLVQAMVQGEQQWLVSTLAALASPSPWIWPTVVWCWLRTSGGNLDPVSTH